MGFGARVEVSEQICPTIGERISLIAGRMQKT
jgi:hypothetical protein